ncbi:hypothetical protein [Legionella drozanskii]|uniref:Transmembrane protein n=1 Tax=Legionella drozanskii LLAP-1 TaxID=1212489 RepID=A0A0W0SM95_9GAMM|nr:hypothetical protein [Legionella drozanskii]KTC84388.1 hypothetical protein Ldro_2991 [Legionella drozanskii LLAP-1]
MTTTTLKEQLSEDLNRLKKLQIDILPPGMFYPKVARLMAIFYLVIVGFPLLFTLLLKGSQLSASFYFSDWLNLSILFIVVGLICVTKFAEYVTFNETIKPHLVLGDTIQRLFKFYFICFSVVYAIWAALYTTLFYSWDFAHLGERGLTVIPGFLFGLIVSSTLFEMELTRVGAAAIFEVISNARNKETLKTD